MHFILLLAIASLASSASLDVDECVSGESFWCKSLAAAETCDRVDYCKETAWKNAVLEQEDNSDTCLFCKAVVLDSRNLKAKGKSEDEIGQFMDAACDILPSSALASQCHQLVGNKVFRDVSTSDVQPEVTCGLLGICRGLQNTEDVNNEQESQSSAETDSENFRNGLTSSCTDCNKFFTSLKRLLENDTQAFLGDLLRDQICPLFGSMRKQCEDTVKSYVPLAFRFAVTLMDPKKICKQLQMCPKSEDMDQHVTEFEHNTVNWEELKSFHDEFSDSIEYVQKTSSCADCNKFFTSLKGFLGTETAYFVRDLILYRVCPSLGGGQRLMCKVVAEKFLPRGFQYAVKYMNPSTTCKGLNMCQKSDEETSINDNLETEDGDILLFDETNVNIEDKQSKSCPDCVKFFESLKTFIQGPTTDLIGDVIFEKLCPLMGNYRKMCEDFAANNLRKAITYSLQFLNSTVVCKAMKLCPKKSSDQFDWHPTLEIDLSSIDWNELFSITEVDKTDWCGMCKTATTFVQAFFKNPTTKDLVRNFLRTVVCSFLGPAKGTCQMIVDTAVPYIFDLLTQFLDPGTFCKLIRLCPKMIADSFSEEEEEMLLPWSKINKFKLDCQSCETLVPVLVQVINDTTPEPEIRKAMLAKCDSVEKKAECRMFVKRHGWAIIKDVKTEKLQPKAICVKLKYCQAAIFHFDVVASKEVL